MSKAPNNRNLFNLSDKQVAGGLAVGSGLTGLMSGIASLQASRIEARQFKIQGIFDNLAINQEKLKARENALFLKKRFLANIGSANASLAARNVSLSSGIGRRLTIESLRNLGEDLQATALNSQAAQNALTLRASTAKERQQTVRNLGLLRASQGITRSTSSLLTGFKTLKQEG